MAAEPWYHVGTNDVFPEEFETFLLGQPRLRRAFMRHHRDLLSPEYWQAQQRRIEQGVLDDVYPYAEQLRFRHYPQ
jgi:isocitrate dehydrogenase kinase/phosphatase